jgi:CRISPR-associated protein Cas1
LRRGSILISDDQSELGLVDLDGVLSVILTSRGASLTTPFINEMGLRNIPVIICNERYQPVSIALPIIQHSDQHRRFEAQANVKQGVKNKVWQRLVMAKIRNQSSLLRLIGANSAERLKRLSSSVKAGDPENVEAQAAQVYWPSLFGSEFRRDRHADGINSLLNYGYAILRSSMVSAVISSGLHPTFGIFHKNKNNALCLVDDLMEPYRPLVDQLARRLFERGCLNLTPEVKRCLAAIVRSDQASVGATSPLLRHMSDMSYSLWKIFDGDKVVMSMPELMPELEVEAMVSEC